MKDRIIIDKSLIPYQFEISLPSDTFIFHIKYNKVADLFTITLYKNDELICTEPIIYNVALFKDIYQNGTYPVLEIIPFDESKEEVEVTWSNFGKTVFLSVFNDGDNDE